MSSAEDVLFGISPEFIEEQKQASAKIQGANLVKPRQKFAPYTRAEREKRRKEVYRLHIELGTPAVRIAELMKVDRNTINADIRAIYNELTTPSSLGDDFTRFTARLEGQRGRLMEYLSKEKDLQAKLMIERQITDIDARLLSASQRIEENAATVFARAAEIINKYMEEQKLNYRAITAQQFLRVSPEGLRAMMNILRKEKVIK